VRSATIGGDNGSSGGCLSIRDRFLLSAPHRGAKKFLLAKKLQLPMVIKGFVLFF
jgi:hypothetical protein